MMIEHINRFIVIILLFLFASNGFAQAPKYSNEFLAIGVGARSLAMANSTVASVNDVTATYWNPAGIIKIPHSMQLGVMHNEYFAGLANYDYGALAARIDDKSSFGISFYRFGVDNIPNTLELIDSDGNIRYDRIKSFSVADYSFMASYARESEKYQGLRYGGNLKIIRRVAGDFAAATGFGFDVGAQYMWNKWLFGVSGRDITTTFNFWSFNTTELEEVFLATNNEIPENSLELTLPKFILGAARIFTFKEKFEVLAELDADITTDGKRNVLVKTNLFSIDPHFGAEINYNRLVYFRLGLGNFQKVPDFDNKDAFSLQPNIGLGIKLKRLTIDYALTDIGDQSIALYSNVFSLQFAIDKVNMN